MVGQIDIGVTNMSVQDCLENLNQQQQEDELKRISSCFFSVNSVLSDDQFNNFELNQDDEDEHLLHESFFGNSSSSDGLDIDELTAATAAVTKANMHEMTVNGLYHEVMFNVFSYLTANDLMSFSVTARRPNFDCFYFLQLKVEHALQVGKNLKSEDERNWGCTELMSGSGAVARLAALDEKKADRIVQAYRDSNLPHGISLSLRAQLAAAAAQKHKAATMMVTALGAASMMGNESAQAILSMGMCAQLVRSSMQNLNVKDVQERMNSILQMPHLPLPESCFESIFPPSVVSHLSAFAVQHGFVKPGANAGDKSAHEAFNDEKKLNDFEVKATMYPYNHNAPGESKHHTVPSGCVGMYTKTVREAALEIRGICKERRQRRFDYLDVDFRRHLCSTFIDACTSDQHYDTVVNLVRNQGVDPDGFYVNAENVEACGLHVAASSGALEILEFLCKGIDENDSGQDGGLCDINQLDDNGWSALHFAAGSNCVDAVAILASYGAKLTVEAYNGYTPYHWAERLSNTEVAQELKRHNADKKFTFIFGTVQPLQQVADRFFAFNH